jgi:transmembrane 9 superfamily member 2/4
VNKLTSGKTLLPIEYYRLPFCNLREGKAKMDSNNLGQFLVGDRIESSPYMLNMKTEMYCEQLCKTNLGPAEQPSVTRNRVVKAIRKSYHNNWIVDNLPAASIAENDKYIQTKYWQGFPIGFINEGDKKAYVNNHVNILIEYHAVERLTDAYRVVRFTVEPFSIAHRIGEAIKNLDDLLLPDKNLPTQHKIQNPIRSCDPNMNELKHTDYDMVAAGGHTAQLASGEVLFTYDVIWTENQNLHWASRWDIYLFMNNAIPAKVHWLSIANSMVVVLCLSTVVGVMLVRLLHSDIDRDSKEVVDEELRADDLIQYGWKLVHADVFRPPSYSLLLLAVSCGSGAQVLCMTLMTALFSFLGILNPLRPGHLLMGELLSYALMGGVNGYVMARLFKSYKGETWLSAIGTAALGLPGIAFILFLITNFIASVHGSTLAVPFQIMIVLFVLWLGISTPMVCFGAYIGYQQNVIEYPVSTISIPRQVPDQPWFTNIILTSSIGGIVPFGACYVEWYHIMSSLWIDSYYNSFGFLLLALFIVILICAEITMLFTYGQLCREDYHWWWRSFCNGGSVAIYVFIYAIVYFQNLQANTIVAYFLYFGFMSFLSLCLFFMMGFVGLSSSLWFCKLIFGTIDIKWDENERLETLEFIQREEKDRPEELEFVREIYKIRLRSKRTSCFAATSSLTD